MLCRVMGLMPRGWRVIQGILPRVGICMQSGDVCHKLAIATSWLIQSGDDCHKLALPQVGEYSRGTMFERDMTLVIVWAPFTALPHPCILYTVVC